MRSAFYCKLRTNRVGLSACAVRLRIERIKFLININKEFYILALIPLLCLQIKCIFVSNGVDTYILYRTKRRKECPILTCKM